MRRYTFELRIPNQGCVCVLPKSLADAWLWTETERFNVTGASQIRLKTFSDFSVPINYDSHAIP
uniref:Uncharacterized protein n=1 Tax=Anguilla anguilla TaxID=7936 RepID=A0A0E9UR71_ANGAN